MKGSTHGQPTRGTNNTVSSSTGIGEETLCIAQETLRAAAALLRCCVGKRMLASEGERRPGGETGLVW